MYILNMLAKCKVCINGTPERDMHDTVREMNKQRMTRKYTKSDLEYKTLRKAW